MATPGFPIPQTHRLCCIVHVDFLAAVHVGISLSRRHKPSCLWFIRAEEVQLCRPSGDVSDGSQQRVWMDAGMLFRRRLIDTPDQQVQPNESVSSRVLVLCFWLGYYRLGFGREMWQLQLRSWSSRNYACQRSHCKYLRATFGRVPSFERSQCMLLPTSQHA
jgi:hypothetical protein